MNSKPGDETKQFKTNGEDRRISTTTLMTRKKRKRKEERDKNGDNKQNMLPMMPQLSLKH